MPSHPDRVRRHYDHIEVKLEYGRADECQCKQCRETRAQVWKELERLAKAMMK